MNSTFLSFEIQKIMPVENFRPSPIGLKERKLNAAVVSIRGLRKLKVYIKSRSCLGNLTSGK